LHISCGYTFPADPKILRKQLPTKVFIWKPKSLTKSAGKSAKKAAELATKKVEAEPELVPRLAGG